jgi:hypothetical protein
MNKEELVKKLTEEGEDKRLSELLVQMTRFRFPFVMLDREPPEEFTELEKNLRRALDDRYPNAIDWSPVYPQVTVPNAGKTIVPRDIKELYVRFYIEAQKHM